MAKWTPIAIVILAITLVFWLGDSILEDRTQELPRPLPTAEPSDAPPAVHPSLQHPALPVKEIAVPEPIPLIDEEPASNLSVLVLDDLGEPVADVHVRANLGVPPWDQISSRTGRDGRVQIACPFSGYTVTVNGRRHSNGTHSSVYFEELIERETVDLVAVIARNSAAVRLTVRDGFGEPVVGLLIGAKGSGASSDDAAPKQTDDRGEVSWSELTPGWRTFTVEGDDPTLDLTGHSRISVELVANTTTSAEWSLERNAQVIVDLRSVPFLSELEEVSLNSEDRDPPWPPELTWLVPAGEHTLRPIWSADSLSYSGPRELSVTEGEVLRVPLVVETGTVSLSGRVVDTSGVPVEGVMVIASVYKSVADNSAGNTLANKWVTTDASGAWSHRGLPWGELTVLANCLRVPGRHFGDGVTICSGTTPEGTHVDFGDTTVTPAARLVCELPDTWLAQLEDASQVELQLLRIEPPPRWPGRTTRGKTEQPGLYKFKHVVPGDYVLRLENREGEVLASEALSVPANSPEGQPLRVRIGNGELLIPTGH